MRAIVGIYHMCKIGWLSGEMRVCSLGIILLEDPRKSLDWWTGEVVVLTSGARVKVTGIWVTQRQLQQQKAHSARW